MVVFLVGEPRPIEPGSIGVSRNSQKERTAPAAIATRYRMVWILDEELATMIRSNVP